MLGYTVLFFALINSSYCGKSFTIVLDRTFSMKEELGVIKASVRALNFENQTDFENYILVSFKDTNVDPPFIYNNPKDLVAQINTVTTSAPARVCPENSLAAIEDALRFSRPESFIFVFTDAFPKDYDRLDNIKNLCRDSHSQVIIFLSGYCLTSVNTETGSEVYHDIAKSCSGVSFNFANTNELRQAFRFMQEITKTSWTDITSHEKFEDFQQFTVTLDSFTTDFIIVTTGDYPEIDVFNNYQSQLKENILYTRHALVTRLMKTEPGSYTVKVRGHGSNTVTVYERSQLSFEFGFSTRKPNELRETTARPIAGWTNYILIQIDYSTIQLTEIEWLTYRENVKKILYLEQKRPGLYVTTVFVEPGKSFRFWIKGRNSDTYQDIKGSSKTLFPQITEANPMWTKPQAEIFEPETHMVDFSNNITLICKVIGYPKPNITWENDDGTILPSEEILLEIPNVSLSYMTLSNASKNTTVNCKCINHEGADSQSIDIYVNRTLTFNVLQSPEDTKVEYGNELKLYCEIDAYPQATVTWYINKTELETAYIEDNALVVDNVELDDNGVYECAANNGIEQKTFSAVVTVTGIEAPEIDKANNEVSLKPGDWKEIDCSVNKGKPKPDITWKYKSLEAFQFDDLPSDIENEDGRLKIRSADKKHGGTYRCIATNAIGQDSKDIIMKIEHAPIIKNNNEQDNVSVRKDDEVRLECEVESSPEAVVRWEMLQDDVIINFDEHHKIDESNTLSFVARWNDSGSYHCIAENNVGRADKSIFLNVLVPPFIEAPISEVIVAQPGSNVTLPCNVLYGNPAPTTKWEFRAQNSAPRVILRDNSTLHLINVSRLQEGTYMCVVENSIDNDRIIYQLKVHV